MRQSLISSDDPPPFSIYNADGAAKVLLICDHASRAMPKAMNQLGLADWVLERHVAWDIGAASVCRHLADRLDAPAILAGYSRLIVDVNRGLDDPAAFLAVSDGIAIPANIDLTDAEKARRVESFFDPYHEAISKKLEQFEARGIAPAFIAVHSCTPVFDRIVRPWHVGVLWDRDGRIARPMLDRLSARDGVAVGDNEPYSGRDPHDYTIDHHAEAAGIPHVGIEVRQDLVDTEAGARQWADILGDSLEETLADPSLYCTLPGSEASASTR